MPTYYIDFEGGNDANTGLSFAQRWKTITNGATAARIAPGDEIRIMASPDPTSIGSATWTGGGRPAAINISSSTNATPIVITTSSAHGLVTGDYVSITTHSPNTNANGVWRVGTTPTSTSFQILQIDGTNTTGNGVGVATGTVTKVNNCMVKTASPLVQNIALCGGLGQKPAWTITGSNSSTQNTTTFREGGSSVLLTISSLFTTGKVAYYTLPSTLDLSAYQQVSFWVQQASGTLGAAGQVYVALCTDTLGDTVAHTCNVPALGALSAWVPVTVNLGANLNSAIRSVALYVVTDLGAQQFLLDNITANKAASSADSVTLQSLISKSDGTGDEAWYAIQSINSDAIMLANENGRTSTSAGVRGYNGTTETVTTYKRETVKTTPVAASTTSVSTVNDNGTAANPIVYSGGWNRTDMSTQTGRTWLDGQNGLGRGFGTDTVTRSFINVDRIDLCRYGTGISAPVSGFDNCTFASVYATGNTSSGIELNAVPQNFTTFTSVWANNNGGSGVLLSGFGCAITDVKLASNNVASGLFIGNSQSVSVGSLIAGNNASSAADSNLRFSGCLNCTVGTAVLTNTIVASAAIAAANAFNCSVNGGSSTGNVSGVFCSGVSPGTIYLNNFTINESAEVTISLGSSGSFVYSNRHDNTDNNSWVFQPNIGTTNQQTAVVDSPATTAWQMRPTTTSATARTPVILKLGTIVCAASSAVTVTARMRRTNTGLTMRLICPGGQISGVANDVFSDMTAAANTWQTVSITFTPTKAGAVDIYAYAFGGTTLSGFVSNLTASQV